MNKKPYSLLFLMMLLSSCQENPLAGKSTVAANFHPGIKAPPKITSISPTQGPYVGGTNITITGVAFQPTATVKIGELNCAQLTYVSQTTLICLTPQHTMGVKDVLIVNKDGQKDQKANAFTYISNVSSTPGFGINSGGKKAIGTTMQMDSTIGEPVQGEVMTGPTVQMRVGVQGILFNPN